MSGFDAFDELILARVREVFCAARLEPWMDLRRDLNGDSLDVIELQIGLEQVLMMDVSSDDMETIRTVGDVLDYARHRREACAGVPPPRLPTLRRSHS